MGLVVWVWLKDLLQMVFQVGYVVFGQLQQGVRLASAGVNG
jgi:hypothetical protein